MVPSRRLPLNISRILKLLIMKENNPENSSPATSSDAHRGASLESGERNRTEVSAQTLTRIMGIASVADIQMLEGHLEVITSKLATLTSKTDKILAALNNVASIADVSRLETQVSSIRAGIKEAAESVRSNRKSQSENTI